MAYSFTANITPYLAACVYEAMSRTPPVARQPMTKYTAGNVVSNAGYIYTALTTGTTGSGGGPSHTSGTAIDGGVSWVYSGRSVTSETGINSTMYVSLGRQTEWDNPAVPDLPDATPEGQSAVISDATAFLLVKPDDVSLGVARSDWTSGDVYSQYDSTIEQNNYPNPHYTIVDNTFVYKCIDNNNGALSTDAPSGTLSSLIQTADGYVWKFVGLISNANTFKFSTANYVPMPVEESPSPAAGQLSTFVDVQTNGVAFDEAANIVTLIYGEGTDATGTVRTLVAGPTKTVTGAYVTSPGAGYDDNTFMIAYDDATAGSDGLLDVELVAGAVDAINVLNPGIDYTSDANIIIVGDGAGAEATVTIVGGSVSNVVVTTPGSGYTWARAFLIPSEAGAVARAILAPGQGHGTDLRTELGAGAILISKSLLSTFNMYIPTESDTVDGSYRQIGLVTGIRSTTRNADAVMGPAHPEYATPDTLVKYTEGGHVIYTNNIVAVTHTANQEEIIKIAIVL